LTVIRILGLADGGATPYDGQYLVDFDPSRDGIDAWGRPMKAHLVTTPDPAQALHLSAVDAHRLWVAVDRRNPRRSDGKPNRPLTAFTVVIGRP
jgi:hypothetical protein